MREAPFGYDDEWSRLVLTILFWNFPCREFTEQREALEALARTVHHHGVDILVLAESLADTGTILEALNTGDSSDYEAADDPPPPHPNIRFFTQFPARELPAFRSDDRLDVRRLRLPGRREILLAAIHFYDRRNHNPEEQSAKATRVYRTVRDAEIDCGHTRTVLFGDLNMNPFEVGMINAESGFASLPTRSLAARHSDEDYRGPQRFYNPSWSRLGREEPAAPGTYYFDSVSKPFNIFWHHLDQVLVRPALFAAFSDDSFRVLTSIPGNDESTVELIRSTGKHWKLKYSDHLPILFELDPPQEPDHD